MPDTSPQGLHEGAKIGSANKKEHLCWKEKNAMKKVTSLTMEIIAFHAAMPAYPHTMPNLVKVDL